jgi:site-specific DNA-cytosine methylase
MRPRLLDLFCGAGGAATGYHQAGFDGMTAPAHIPDRRCHR